MSVYIYDFEVTKYDWLVVFKNYDTKQYTIFHNDSDSFSEFMTDHRSELFVSFNGKHYDTYIAKAIYAGFSNEEIKALNDFIVVEERGGWEYAPLQYASPKLYYADCDLKLDCQENVSLKWFEANMYMDIRETTVDFNITRSWTKKELAEMVFYCKHDVDATEVLYEHRKDYINTKKHVGSLAGLSENKAVTMTNAQLTAALLKAEPVTRDDEREYVYPDNLLKEYIPQNVLDFFNQLYDKSIPDEVLFKSKLNFKIGECSVTVGWGGIHGAIKGGIFKEEYGLIIRNYDVGSYYPHLMTINGYTSRNIPNAKIFSDVLDTRMKAKAEGDEATNKSLKLVCNTTYGATLNSYNKLYDAKNARSVCISGQLYLLELTMHLVELVPDIRIVQLNTDGIMIQYDESYDDTVQSLVKEWQERTKFSLEEDRIVFIAQKDVNNYIEKQENGKIKGKGSWLVKGESTVGAYKISNTEIIVAEALKEALLNGTPVEDTINACNDVHKFQLIARAGSTYQSTFQLVDGQRVPIQKVNRVYATKDSRYGRLYKVKDGSAELIASMPDHCIIDNSCKISIDEIDKSYYIDIAKTKLENFRKKGKIKGKNKMAESKLNVYQKLLTARTKVLEKAVTKSGKNMNMSYKYFELDDLVPVVTEICNELGLLTTTQFTADTAKMIVVNTEKPTEIIEFEAPFTPIEPIVSNTGKQVTNTMQAMGASFTYMRRYLIMQAFDICEPDTIDATSGSTVPEHVQKAEAKPKANVPATPAQRTTTKIALTATDDKATELQIKGLKAVLKKLLESDPTKKDYVTKLAVETHSFTTLTKADCEELIEKLQGEVK